MGGLSADDRQHLERVIAGRLGARSNARVLVAAYLDAVARSAYVRTVEDGPVPTSLPVERSLVLIEVSRQLQRVVEDHEIEALFRVSAAQARTMRIALFAMYPDLTNELRLTWSLVDAHVDGRRKGRSVVGNVIVFTDAERRDACAAYAKRLGIGVELLLGDEEQPWKLIVTDQFPRDKLPE